MLAPSSAPTAPVTPRPAHPLLRGEEGVASLSLGETAEQRMEQSETDERGERPETGHFTELQEATKPRHCQKGADECECSSKHDPPPDAREDLAPRVGFVAADRQRGRPGNDGLDRAPWERCDPKERQQGHEVRIRGRCEEPGHADRIGNPKDVCDHAAGKGDCRTRKQLAHDRVAGTGLLAGVTHRLRTLDRWVPRSGKNPAGQW